MSSCGVRVSVRFRPLNSREKEIGSNSLQISFPNENSLELRTKSTGAPHRYVFDYVFGVDSTQDDVYTKTARPIIEDVLEGYNGTIFAYGQTGSGKTHTMLGPDVGELSDRGVIPHATAHMIEEIMNDQTGTEFSISCSYLEIYKETIRDLLDHTKTNLHVRESPLQGIFVDGLTSEFVSGEDEILALLSYGAKHRAVASTGMNAQSSRSHSVFILCINQKLRDGSTKAGKLNLVDLAGSEKISKTGAVGETLQEAKKINQSLSALGMVIAALADAKPHVPYRDSKLTRILQESLGGNCKTSLIVAASPHEFNLDETISTLNFAKRAKTIKNIVKVNARRSAEEMEMMIAQLTKDLNDMRRYSQGLEKKLGFSGGQIRADYSPPEFASPFDDQAFAKLRVEHANLLDSTTKELEDLRSENKSLRVSNQALTEQVEGLASELATTNKRLAEAVEDQNDSGKEHFEFEQLNLELENAFDHIATLEDQNRDLKKTLLEVQDLLDGQQQLVRQFQAANGEKKSTSLLEDDLNGRQTSVALPSSVAAGDTTDPDDIVLFIQRALNEAVATVLFSLETELGIPSPEHSETTKLPTLQVTDLTSLAESLPVTPAAQVALEQELAVRKKSESEARQRLLDVEQQLSQANVSSSNLNKQLSLHLTRIKDLESQVDQFREQKMQLHQTVHSHESTIKMLEMANRELNAKHLNYLHRDAEKAQTEVVLRPSTSKSNIYKPVSKQQEKGVFGFIKKKFFTDEAKPAQSAKVDRRALEDLDLLQQQLVVVSDERDELQRRFEAEKRQSSETIHTLREQLQDTKARDKTRPSKPPQALLTENELPKHGATLSNSADLLQELSKLNVEHSELTQAFSLHKERSDKAKAQLTKSLEERDTVIKQLQERIETDGKELERIESILLAHGLDTTTLPAYLDANPRLDASSPGVDKKRSGRKKSLLGSRPQEPTTQFSPLSPAEADPTRSNLEQENHSLKAQIQSLQQEVATSQQDCEIAKQEAQGVMATILELKNSEAERFSRKFEKHSNDISDLALAIDTARTECAQVQAALSASRAQVKDLEAQLEAERASRLTAPQRVPPASDPLSPEFVDPLGALGSPAVVDPHAEAADGTDRSDLSTDSNPPGRRSRSLVVDYAEPESVLRLLQRRTEEFEVEKNTLALDHACTRKQLEIAKEQLREQEELHAYALQAVTAERTRAEDALFDQVRRTAEMEEQRAQQLADRDRKKEALHLTRLKDELQQTTRSHREQLEQQRNSRLMSERALQQTRQQLKTYQEMLEEVNTKVRVLEQRLSLAAKELSREREVSSRAKASLALWSTQDEKPVPASLTLEKEIVELKADLIVARNALGLDKSDILLVHKKEVSTLKAALEKSEEAFAQLRLDISDSPQSSKLKKANAKDLQRELQSRALALVDVQEECASLKAELDRVCTQLSQVQAENNSLRQKKGLFQDVLGFVETETAEHMKSLDPILSPQEGPESPFVVNRVASPLAPDLSLDVNQLRQELEAVQQELAREREVNKQQEALLSDHVTSAAESDSNVAQLVAEIEALKEIVGRQAAQIESNTADPVPVHRRGSTDSTSSDRELHSLRIEVESREKAWQKRETELEAQIVDLTDKLKANEQQSRNLEFKQQQWHQIQQDLEDACTALRQENKNNKSLVSEWKQQYLDLEAKTRPAVAAQQENEELAQTLRDLKKSEAMTRELLEDARASLQHERSKHAETLVEQQRKFDALAEKCAFQEDEYATCWAELQEVSSTLSTTQTSLTNTRTELVQKRMECVRLLEELATARESSNVTLSTQSQESPTFASKAMATQLEALQQLRDDALHEVERLREALREAREGRDGDGDRLREPALRDAEGPKARQEAEGSRIQLPHEAVGDVEALRESLRAANEERNKLRDDLESLRCALSVAKDERDHAVHGEHGAREAVTLAHEERDKLAAELHAVLVKRDGEAARLREAMRTAQEERDKLQADADGLRGALRAAREEADKLRDGAVRDSDAAVTLAQGECEKLREDAKGLREALKKAEAERDNLGDDAEGLLEALKQVEEERDRLAHEMGLTAESHERAMAQLVQEATDLRHSSESLQRDQTSTADEVTTLKEALKEAQQLQTSTADEVTTLKEALKEAQELQTSTADEVATLKEALKEAQQVQDAVQREHASTVAEVGMMRESLRSSHEHHEQAQKEVESLQESLARTQELRKRAEQEAAQLRMAVESLQSEQEEATEALVANETELADLHQRLLDVDTEKSRIESELDEAQSQLQQLQASQAKDSDALHEVSGQLQAATSALQESQTRCSELESQLHRQRAEMEAASANNEELTTRLEALTNSNKELSSQLEDARHEATLLSAANQDAQGKLSVTQNEIQRLVPLETKCAELQIELDTASSMQSAKANELQKQIEDVQRKLQDRENDLVSMEQEFTTQMAEISRSKAQVEQKSEGLQAAYEKEVVQGRQLRNSLEDLKGQIRVFARARPMFDASSTCCLKHVDPYTIQVTQGTGDKTVQKQFTFNQCFAGDTSQEEVCSYVLPLVQSAVDGYNVSVFAYGQTGTGKTHTMLGSPSQPGLALQAIDELHRIMRCSKQNYDFSIRCYMLELYNDTFVDLLADKSKAAEKLEVKTNSQGMVYVQNVTIKDAGDEGQLQDILNIGFARRRTAGTDMNAQSSRSHFVFSILIEGVNKINEKVATGKLSLVDLAGSERVARSGAVNDQDRLKEAQAINKSLSALGDVIYALTAGDKFVPYRNNKLTMLLSDSLGGNAKTLMFVNISPEAENADETVNSLVFASRVREVTNQVNKMVETKEMARLRKEVQALRGEIATRGLKSPVSGEAPSLFDDAGSDESRSTADPVEVVQGSAATEAVAIAPRSAANNEVPTLPPRAAASNRSPSASTTPARTPVGVRPSAIGGTPTDVLKKEGSLVPKKSPTAAAKVPVKQPVTRPGTVRKPSITQRPP